jgi:hypothetical protein
MFFLADSDRERVSRRVLRTEHGSDAGVEDDEVRRQA